MCTLSELLQSQNITGLRTYRIAENEVLIEPHVLGYAYENGAWVLYEVDERCCKTNFKKFATEEEAIQKLFSIIKAYYIIGR